MSAVVRYWPATAEATRTALRLAKERGQLVLAERHGDVVRVVLRQAEVVRTPTAPRQHPDKTPRQRARWIAAGALTLAGLTALLGWAIYLLFVWLAAHVVQVLGVVGALLGALWLLSRVGVCPGVHCPGCRHR